jgi:hypothetical protein
LECGIHYTPSLLPRFAPVQTPLASGSTAQWTGKTSIPTNVYRQVDGWTGKIGKGGVEGRGERQSVKKPGSDEATCTLFTFTSSVALTLHDPSTTPARPQHDPSGTGAGRVVGRLKHPFRPMFIRLGTVGRVKRDQGGWVVPAWQRGDVEASECVLYAFMLRRFHARRFTTHFPPIFLPNPV